MPQCSKTWLAIALTALLSACSSNPESESASSKQAVADETSEPSVSSISSSLLDVEWRTALGTGAGRNYVRLQLQIDGETVYAADPTGGLFAVDIDSGRIQWQQDSESSIVAGLTLVPGAQKKLLAATLDGYLRAYDPASGEELWSTELTSEAVAPAGFDTQKAYVHTVDGRVTAVSLDAGKTLWSYEVQQPVLTVRGTASPVAVNDLVVVGTASGKVVALDAELGIPQWEHRLAFPDGRSELERLVDVDGTVLADSNVFYAASYNGKVAAIALNGEPRWEEDASSFTAPVSSIGNLYLTLENGEISARSMASGDKVWTQSRLQGLKVSAVSLVGKYLAVTDGEGFLYLLSRVDGSLLARKDLRPVIRHVSVPNQTEAARWRVLRGKDFGIRSKIVATNTGMLVYTNDGVLIRVDIESD